MMAEAPQISWRIRGDEVVSCNCAWGCPCQFNALPTKGRCEGVGAIRIVEGHFGEVRLDGVAFAIVLSWPGAIHEGNGTMHLIVDERATDEQRRALADLASARHGGAFWEIFSAVCPNQPPPKFLPIQFESDRARRVARLRIDGIVETNVGPIKNPVTGEEHRAKIVLPNGFEYKEAEMGNTLSGRVRSAAVSFDLQNTYAQLAEIDWSN
jgi:hypothetical protein